MKIIADENLAYPKELFSQFGEVVLINGRHITNSALKNADALLIRSVTKVDESLLRGSDIKFIGTATIGTDHIDTEYLRSENIVFSSAPGCNSYAVAEYVIAALLNTALKNDFCLRDKSIGIVGYGNVGKKVAKLCGAFGMKVMINDPPLFREGKITRNTPLDRILESDIISLHVPLHYKGRDKTYHLINKERLESIKNGSIIINTSRGSVIDENALINVASKKNLKLILDVWDNEPFISERILEVTTLGTPHVAGYTFEGKVNGSIIICEALASFLGKTALRSVVVPPVSDSEMEFIPESKIELAVNRIIGKIYNVERDHNMLFRSLLKPFEERGEYFDKLRKDYPLRREFNNYLIKVNSEFTDESKLLNSLRFKVSAL